MFSRWRELLEFRTAEAIRLLGAIEGVHGLIVGGSVGRGEPWPMSDIDLLPVYADRSAAERVGRAQSEIVDWWAASGRAQTLDTGWLAFDTDEIAAALEDPPSSAVERLAEPRWFHGIDKSYGGHAADPDDELTTAFLAWVGQARFDPVVVAGRIAWWRERAARARDAAHAALERADLVRATVELRESAQAFRLVTLESWGERLGSMGREFTKFERMAAARGQSALAAEIVELCGADPVDAYQRSTYAPPWLAERIELCRQARQLIAEDVTPEQNARDQLVAFTTHVVRHRPDLIDDWTGLPDPRLDEHLDRLDQMLAGA